MNVEIKDLDPVIEAALTRSNDANNQNTGGTMTVEEFAIAEALACYTLRHVSLWRQVDAEALTSKLAKVADKLTPQDIAAIDAIVASKADAVVDPNPIEIQPVIP